MEAIGRDLWKIAREFRNSDLGPWLTLLASIWIVSTAGWTIFVRVYRGSAKLIARFRKGKPDDDDLPPEGA